MFRQVWIFLIVSIFLFSCSSDDPVAITGNISGIVTESSSSEPISGANVSLTGEVNQSTSTGNNGSYGFSDITAGSYQIKVSKLGYLSQTKSITLQAEKTSTSNFSLQKNLPSANPNQLELSTEEYYKSIELENTRSDVINFTTQTSKEWIKVNPSTGSINQGNKLIITITAELENLPYNTYNENLLINVGEASLSIPVKVVHTEPPYITITSPKKDEVYKMGNTMSINWDSNLNGKISIDLVRENDVKVEVSTQTDNNEGGSFSWEITELVEEYYTLRLTSKENDDISDETEPFKIEEGPTKPLVITKDSEEILTDKISILGELTSFGIKFDKVTQYGHIFSSTDENPKIDSNKTNLGETSQIGEFKSELNDLSPGTSYYIRAYAVNEKGVGYGEVKTITTTVGVPSVETLESINIEQNKATLEGRVLNDGGSSLLERGFVYGTESPVNIDSYSIKDSESTIGEYSLEIDNLTSGTLYYFRAYSKNSNGISYGEQKSFTTSSVEPSVETISAVSENSNTISVIGNVSDNGGDDLNSYGFVYSEGSSTPTLDDSVLEIGQNTLGEFNGQISDLQPSTSYSIRAYASNQIGTTYGNVLNVETDEGVYFNITSPSLNEEIDANTTYSIEWNSNLDNEQLVVQHYRGNQFISDLGSTNSSTNSFQWEIDPELLSSSNNKIRIISENTLEVLSESEIFTINKYFLIVNPSSSSSFHYSDIISIKWYSNFSENIKIELYETATFITEVTNSINTDEGVLNWNSNVSLPDSTNYRFRVTNLNTQESFFSDYFTVFNTFYEGQTYGGGIIVYLFVGGDPGYIQGEQHGLIASIENIGCDSNMYAAPGQFGYSNLGLSSGIGYGLSNTQKIIDSYPGNTNLAAYKSKNYSAGGYNDWYLPSYQEMLKIYPFISSLSLTGCEAGSYSGYTSSGNSGAIYVHNVNYYQNYITTNQGIARPFRSF
jgi:hypothetical protein